MDTDKKNGNNYEWVYLSQFCARTHGFPYEWLERLQFNKTYNMVEKLVQTSDSSEESIKQANVVFNDEFIDKRRTLWEIANQDIFLEAILLSSPVFLNTIETYLQEKEAVLSGYRKNHIRNAERKIALYLQRFCAKNDTNSFFGPSFWGVVDDNIKEKVVLIPKKVSERFVSYEYWAVDKIAQCINKDEKIKFFIEPRLNPSYRLDALKKEILKDTGEKINLTRQETEILNLCNGENSFKDILTQLAKEDINCNHLESVRNSISTILEDLEKRDIVIWQILLPQGLFDPLQYLINFLNSKVPDSYQNKVYWLNILNELNALKIRFKNSDFRDRKNILIQINELFEKVTQEKSTRKSGEMYAGRLLIFEEASRNIESFELSKEFMNNLSNDLFPIVEWYRVILFYLVKRFEKKIIDKLKEEFSTNTEISLAKLLDMARQGIKKDEEELRNSAMEYFSHIDRYIKDKCEDLSQDNIIKIVKRKLEPPNKTFLESPENDCFWLNLDIMLIADGIDKINEGEYKILISEMHPFPVLFSGVFTWQNKLINLLNREWVEITKHKSPNRTLAQICIRHKNKVLMHHPMEEIYEIEYDRIKSQYDSRHIIPLSDLAVILKDNKLIFKFRSKGTEIAVTDFLMELNTMAISITRQLLRQTFPNTACRLEINNIVFRRMGWCIEIDNQFRNRFDKVGLDLFIEMIRFKNEYRLPTQIFVRVRSERKPIMIDFRDYFLLEILKNLFSKNGSVSISEMLPSSDQFWLRDEQGRYSSEFRMMWTYRK